MRTIAEKPDLHQLVKAAMAGTISQVDINAEAARQVATQDGGVPQEQQEEAAPHLSTEYIGKLASALGYLAEQTKLADQGNVQMPGVGPGTLGVLPATSKEKNIDAGEGGQATAAAIPPKNPPTQGEVVQVGKANTGLETNDDMKHSEQPKDPWKNEKATLQNAFTQQSGDPTTKTSEALYERNLERMLQVGEPQDARVSLVRAKLAEDAIYPAKVEAEHKEVPPAATPSEKGKVKVPSDTNRQMSLVRSNQSAIDYTKGQAKADPKSDLGKVLDEPALSAAHDQVLQKTLDHTGEAGVKISMAQGVNRVDAARAFLSNLMDKVSTEAGKKAEGKKKEKESMMGAAPSSPSQIANPVG